MGFLERWAIRITWAEQRAGRKQTRSRVFFFLPFFIRWAVYSSSAGDGVGGMAMAEQKGTAQQLYCLTLGYSMN